MAERKFNCLFYRKEKLGILKCGGCKAVHYCSKYCQRKDWPVHKESCIYEKKTGSTSGTGARVVSCGANAKPKTVNPDFTKAFKAAKYLFPGLRVETTFKSEIPNITDPLLEMFRRMRVSSHNPCVFQNMLVVRIVKGLEEFQMRFDEHIFLVADEDASMAPLFFDSKYNATRPGFTWDEVKPGRFICIMDPAFWFSPDGTKGFRICDLREIYLLNKLD